MWGLDWPTLLAAVTVGVLGVARMTRTDRGFGPTREL